MLFKACALVVGDVFGFFLGVFSKVLGLLSLGVLLQDS